MSDDIKEILPKFGVTVYNQKLGHGSYGDVYLGKYDDGKRVAVKYFENIDMSIHEDRILSLIGKPCSPYVLCLEFFSMRGNGLLGVEYIEGFDLQKVYDRRKQENSPFLQEELIFIMRSAIHGLSHMHNLGVIHHDLKPGNIMFDDKNKILKLIDFGLSCIPDARYPLPCHSGDGTPEYIDPLIMLEMSNKDENITLEMWEKSDVYSLGLTFYALANLHFPTEYYEPWQIGLNKHRNIITFSKFRGKTTNYSLLINSIIMSMVNTESWDKRESLANAKGMIDDIFTACTLNDKRFTTIQLVKYAKELNIDTDNKSINDICTETSLKVMANVFSDIEKDPSLEQQLIQEQEGDFWDQPIDIPDFEEGEIINEVFSDNDDFLNLPIDVSGELL